MNNRQSNDFNQSIAIPDIYTRVTDKIMADLERGALTWRKPWNSDHLEGRITRPLRHNSMPYTGINILMLWATASEKDFALPHWMTFKQALELKGNVRKGEKGTQIVYADQIVKPEENSDGKTEMTRIPFLKTYTVFNASQIENLPAHYYETPEPVEVNPEERKDELENFFAQTKADIHTGKQAAYAITVDKIEMPPFETFTTALDYYSVLSHEITHWTRHPTRLDRDFGRKKYGDEGYAKEELVAELGSCFLAADLGFEPMPEQHHAAYIQSWLKALKDDKRLIFSAASHAQKAVEFLHSLQPL
jgi:antirestriction protein ArdC